MIRHLAAIIAVLLAGSILLGGEAQDWIDDPPQGFEWQSCEGAGLSILKPLGWHYKHVGASSHFLSKENIDEKGYFRVGLTAHFFSDISRTGTTASHFAESTAKRIVERLGGEGPSTRVMDIPDYGPIRNLIYRVRVPDGSVRVHGFLIADEQEDCVYHLQFESPTGEWEDNWKLGDTMLGKVALTYFADAEMRNAD